MKKRLVAIVIVLMLVILSMPLNGSSMVFAADNIEPFEQTGVPKDIGEYEGESDFEIDVSNITSKYDSLSEEEEKLSTKILQLIDSNYLESGRTTSDVISEMQMQNQITDGYITEGTDERGSGPEVYVYIKFNEGGNLSSIEPYVSRIENQDEQYDLAAAWVSVDNIMDLAALEDVRSIREVTPPITNTGSVLSEGDSVLQADDVRTQLGVDGTGIKIGIISDGVDNYWSAVSSGDLPASLTVLSNTLGGDEGTAMLEIVHDLAPGAQLYFHDAGGNILAFNEAIDNLVEAGCDIICDDISWVTEPFFEDGTVADHVQSVLDATDVIYVSSAGNYANSHFQGLFYNDGYGFNDFSQGTSSNKNLYAFVPAGGAVQVVMQWDEAFGSASSDYDLYILNAADGSYITGSHDMQGEEPFERCIYINDTGSDLDIIIAARAVDAPVDKTLELYIYSYGGANYSNNIVKDDSIFGQAAVPGVISCGAMRYNQSYLETFSSRGPVTMLTEIRQKPDICGSDGVSVTGVGGFGSPFYGTSAAAPHIAAITALLELRFPSMSSSEIKQVIFDNADDYGNSGFDTAYGYGLADARNAALSYLYVTFDSQGGSTVESQLYKSGSKIIKPAGVTNGGLAVVGWYLDETCINEWNFAIDTVTEDITLYAKWGDACNVSFNSMGGSLVDNQIVGEGGRVTEPSAPTKSGYAFKGWYKEEACTNEWDFNTDIVTGDITLYAKWAIIYTVTFDSIGGSAVDSQFVAEGDKLAQPDNPVKKDSIFLGWQVSTSTWDFDNDVVTGDVTLYAIWGTMLDGSGTEADPYLIEDEIDLAYMAYMVNTSNTAFKGDKYYQQTSDIDLSLFHNWTPIGWKVVFDGTYDGAEYTISGINIDVNTDNLDMESFPSSEPGVGLFGMVEGEIKNTHLLGGMIRLTASYYHVYMGGIAGYTDGGKINNSSNSADITLSASVGSGVYYIGGIVGGALEDSTISGCENIGEIVSNGGERVSTGGIVGILNESSIIDCENSGASNVQGQYIYVGGITGQAIIDSMIDSCRNMGMLFVTNATHSKDVGGIVGVGNRANVSESINSGIISVSMTSIGTTTVGGIMGNVATQGSLSDCANTGSVTLENSNGSLGGLIGKAQCDLQISRCYNTGNISGLTPFSTNAGGICGYINSAGSINECYNAGDVVIETPGGEFDIGGLFGSQNREDSLIVSNCFNRGYIRSFDTGGQTGYIGGFVGSGNSSYTTFVNCYNTGKIGENGVFGGIAGEMYNVTDSSFNNCYYADTCPIGIGEGNDAGSNKTISALKQQATFVDFDFTDTWEIIENESFPMLQNVPYVYLDGISLPELLALDVGSSATLTPEFEPVDAIDKSVTWSSSDESIATVSADGVVTLLVDGTATITVTSVDGSYTDTCEVFKRIPVTEISLDITTLELEQGVSAVLTPTVLPADATYKEITWSSSDEDIAIVVGGKVKGIRVGTATITVTNEDSGLAATCEVTVTESPMDVNDDGIVDMLDLVTVSQKYKSSLGDGVYDVICDLNDDGIINLFDLIMVGKLL